MRAGPPTKVRGHVKWFNAQTGLGFVTTEDGEDIFVYRTGIIGPEPKLFADQLVEFEIVPNRKGRRAVNVTPVTRSFLTVSSEAHPIRNRSSA